VLQLLRSGMLLLWHGMRLKGGRWLRGAVLLKWGRLGCGMLLRRGVLLKLWRNVLLLQLWGGVLRLSLGSTVLLRRCRWGRMRRRRGLILIVVLGRCHVRDEQDESDGTPSFQHLTKRRTVVHLLPPGLQYSADTFREAQYTN
jgi:hypothetical protein